MLVKHSIAVKAIVTSEFKEDHLASLRQALKNIEEALRDLDRQGGDYVSEIESKDPTRAAEFREKLRLQVRRQREIQSRLLLQITEVENLRMGDEYSQGTIDGFVQITLGDNLEEKLHKAELVIKDGIVIRIEGE